MAKPARIGQLWTKAEEDSILASIKAGATLAEIAETKQRTTGGIRARLTRIACCFVEEANMTLYEASGRTGIRVARIQEALTRKTEVARAKAECLKPKMEFKFQQTFTRAKLQGHAEETRKANEAAKLQRLREKVNMLVDSITGQVLDAAANEKTSFLYEPQPHHYNVNDGRGVVVLQNDDMLRGFQEKFPDCTVTLAEEWVDQIGRGNLRGVQTRVLKSGIKIDWS
jgi:hypothetical protein